MKTFMLTVASVGETLFEGEAIAATLPGSSGEMTVLSHHEPIVTTLKKGLITVKTADDLKTFPVEGGIAEMSGNRAVVLL